MRAFSTQRIIRIIIYVSALALLGGSLAYSHYLANQLEEKEKKEVQLYADALDIIANVDYNSDSTAAIKYWEFIIYEIVQQPDKRIPRLLVDESGEITSIYPELDETYPQDKKDKIKYQKLDQFKAEHDPIVVEYAPGSFQYVYYGDSFLLKQLRWFPFLQLLVAFAFITVVFIGFAVAKRNEQNRVWVGLAKETAHQLGTPVSSLMAWIELLKLKTEGRTDEYNMLEEMEHDVKRLENITERFSKIGSEPELQSVSLKEVLDRSANYVSKRMTRKGSIKLEVENLISPESILMINPQLFDWVVENLLKNALDAINTREGKIVIEAGEKGEQYFIDITDTGKGIPKGQFNKVFDPGFTTKKRGWGLGLSLSKRIIEQYHKGRIFVKHSELGKGTTFRILLPKHSS